MGEATRKAKGRITDSDYRSHGSDGGDDVAFLNRM